MDFSKYNSTPGVWGKYQWQPKVNTGKWNIDPEEGLKVEILEMTKGGLGVRQWLAGPLKKDKLYTLSFEARCDLKKNLIVELVHVRLDEKDFSIFRKPVRAGEEEQEFEFTFTCPVDVPEGKGLLQFSIRGKCEREGFFSIDNVSLYEVSLR